MNGQGALPALARPSGPHAGALLLAGAALTIAFAAQADPFPPSEAAVGGLGLAVWLLALLAGAAAMSGRDGLGLAQWRLGSWALLCCALTSGLGSITWSHPQYGLVAEIFPSSVVRAEWLIAVAMTAWTAGYCAGPCKLPVAAAARYLRRTARSDVVRGPWVPWLLYGTGTAARLTSLAVTGNLGYVGNAAAAVSGATTYQQAISVVSMCAPLAVAVAAQRAFREHASYARLTLLALFAAESVTTAVAGGKQGFAIAVLAVVIPATAARGKIPVIPVVLGLAVFFAVVLPFNSAYRADVRAGTTSLTPREALTAAPSIASGVLTGMFSQQVMAQSADTLAARIQDINAPAIVMQRSPAQIPYASPLQLPEGVAAQLIPRVLWPGKPILAFGYQFSQKYYGTPADFYSAAAITPWADLYSHGGWAVVVAGMLVLGCLVRVLDDVLDVRSDPSAVFLVLLVFPALVKAENDWITTVACIPPAVAIWLAVRAVTFRREPAAA